MERIVLVAASFFIGILVALTYFVFEAIVRLAINFVWDDIFATDTHRLIIVPLCLVLSLLYFGAVHYLTPKNEKQEERGLGSMPAPTLKNLGLGLLIGFFSLFAGASLGPEAILVPASMIIGGYISVRFFKKNKKIKDILPAAGFVALFAAFFHSFIIGALSLLLVRKQFKGLSPLINIAGLVAAASSTLTLSIINGQSFFHFPPLDWTITFNSALGLIAVFALGFGAIFLLGGLHSGFGKLYQPYLRKKPWWFHAIVASSGLSAIYLIGGPLIQFTGNEAIQPLVHQAGSYTIMGLLLIFIAKVAAIAWSKALGYQGGLIFPSVFIIASIILIVGHVTDVNFIYGIIVGLVGMFVADKWVKILT